jgi:hypothetical protein
MLQSALSSLGPAGSASRKRGDDVDLIADLNRRSQFERS